MTGTTAYVLSKKYTNDSLIGVGAIKGAPCEVQNIVKVNGVTTVTLKWTDTTGVDHTRDFNVNDGISITGASITPTGNLQVTLSDGTVIDCGKVTPQYTSLPAASSSNEGAILQYIGTTGGGYTNGYFYKCVSNGSGGYKWEQYNVQPIVTPQYSVIPVASVDNVGQIIQYTGPSNATYTNGYFYQCKLDGSTYIWAEKKVQAGGGGGGTDDYNDLDNKPMINGIELIGDKSFEDLGIGPLTNPQMDTLLDCII